MIQYTNEIQTTKLIELGFEKPKYECLDTTLRGIEKWNNIQNNYSIGEIFSFLPKSIKVNDCYFTLTISAEFDNWLIEYVDIAYGSQAYARDDVELIDALFAEIVQLKEEGMI